jgi:hypothetical protein
MSKNLKASSMLLAGLLLVGATSAPAVNSSTRANETDIARSLNRVSEALEEANKPKREAMACAAGTLDRQSDLCAQWRAADAATEVASWIPYQFRISLVEIFALSLSLIFSALALIWSVRSFNAFRNAERAHLEFEEMQAGNIKDEGQEAVIAFSVTNTGRSAGTVLGGYVQPHVSEAYPKEWPRPTEPRSVARAYIREGKSHRYGERLSISKQDFSDVLSNKKKLFVDMSIRYEDAFRNKHESRVTANLVLYADDQGRDLFKIINDPNHWRFT